MNFSPHFMNGLGKVLIVYGDIMHLGFKYDLKKYCFPLVVLESDKQEYLFLCGTCFSIGENYFVTAKHVIESAIENRQLNKNRKIFLGFLAEDNEWEFIDVDSEFIDTTLDFGIVHLSEHKDCTSANWLNCEIPFLTDIFTIGFPYALDIEQKVLNYRTFKGHIIGTPFDKEHSYIFELNFQAYRGLSGAPIFVEISGIPHVIGMIIGNKSTEMEVFSSKEIDSDGRTTTHYSKIEVMHIGIGLQNTTLLNSELLFNKVTLQEHLRRLNIITESKNYKPNKSRGEKPKTGVPKQTANS